MDSSGSSKAMRCMLFIYTKMDMPCSEVNDLRERVTDGIINNFKRVLGDIYGKRRES